MDSRYIGEVIHMKAQELETLKPYRITKIVAMEHLFRVISYGCLIAEILTAFRRPDALIPMKLDPKLWILKRKLRWTLKLSRVMDRKCAEW